MWRVDQNVGTRSNSQLNRENREREALTKMGLSDKPVEFVARRDSGNGSEPVDIGSGSDSRLVVVKPI